MLYLTLAILFYIHKIVRCFRRCEICHVFLVGPRDRQTEKRATKSNETICKCLLQSVLLYKTHTHRQMSVCVCVVYTCRAVLRWPYLVSIDGRQSTPAHAHLSVSVSPFNQLVSVSIAPVPLAPTLASPNGP